MAREVDVQKLYRPTMLNISKVRRANCMSLSIVERHYILAVGILYLEGEHPRHVDTIAFWFRLYTPRSVITKAIWVFRNMLFGHTVSEQNCLGYRESLES